MKYTLASSGSCSQSTCTGFKACQWDFHLFDCIATWKMTVFSYCARIPNRQRAFILWWNLWIHPWHQNNIVKISEVSLSQGRILCLLSSWDLERCSYFRRWRYGRDARCVRTCQMTYYVCWLSATRLVMWFAIHSEIEKKRERLQGWWNWERPNFWGEAVKSSNRWASTKSSLNSSVFGTWSRSHEATLVNWRSSLGTVQSGKMWGWLVKNQDGQLFSVFHCTVFLGAWAEIMLKCCSNCQRWLVDHPSSSVSCSALTVSSFCSQWPITQLIVAQSTCKPREGRWGDRGCETA